jgi:hypothetical protein
MFIYHIFDVIKTHPVATLLLRYRRVSNIIKQTALPRGEDSVQHEVYRHGAARKETCRQSLSDWHSNPRSLGCHKATRDCGNCVSNLRAFGAVMSHRDEPSDPFHAPLEVMFRRLSHANLVILDHIVRYPTRKHGASFCTCTAACCIIVLQ